MSSRFGSARVEKMFGTVDAVWLAVFACVVLFLLTRRMRFALPTLRDSDFAIPEKSTPASLLELQRAIAASEAAFEPLSCRKEVVYANAVFAIHGWSASPRELAPLESSVVIFCKRRRLSRSIAWWRSPSTCARFALRETCE